MKLSLIIEELEANEISTLKSLWCILNGTGWTSMAASHLVCNGHDDFTECTQALVDGLCLFQSSTLRSRILQSLTSC